MILCELIYSRPVRGDVCCLTSIVNPFAAVGQMNRSSFCQKGWRHRAGKLACRMFSIGNKS
jgi:hypothetical protein